MNRVCLLILICSLSGMVLVSGKSALAWDFFWNRDEVKVGDERVIRFYKPVIVHRVPEKIVPDAMPMPEPFTEEKGGEYGIEPRMKVAIIIDDMGIDKQRGQALIDMDVPLTLAFLPYADGLAEMTAAAAESGHELMIHMPMEPMNGDLDIGRIGLKDHMQGMEIDVELFKAFESFDGYVGLNNHMGSRLTQNPEIMAHVMERLRAKGLYFVDSRTIKDSIAGFEAKKAGLKTATRDVFLDHKNTPEFVAGALLRAEETAKRKGTAILIGHPKDVTIAGLRAWIPTLEEKGIELVHASALVRSYDPALFAEEVSPTISAVGDTAQGYAPTLKQSVSILESQAPPPE